MNYEPPARKEVNTEYVNNPAFEDLDDVSRDAKSSVIPELVLKKIVVGGIRT